MLFDGDGGELLSSSSSAEEEPSSQRRGPSLRSTTVGMVVAALAVAGLLSLGVAVEWGSQLRGTGTTAAAGELRQLTLMCNANAPIVRLRDSEAQSFNLSSYWQNLCERVEPMPNDYGTSVWEGQNRCWRWVKKLGCTEERGQLSWWEGQRKAAKMGYAPYPEVEPLHPLKQPERCEKYEMGAPLKHLPHEDAEAALKWFTANVAVYVINVKSATARWSTMTRRLSRLGLAWHRIDGLELTEEDMLRQAREEGHLPETFDVERAERNARTDYQAMGGVRGSIGVAASHLSAMRAATEGGNDNKPLALILEDDVVLADDFVPRLKMLLTDEAPCDWNAISLKSMCPHGECVTRHLTRVFPDGNEPKDRCRHGTNQGFYAMLYRVGILEDLRKELATTVWDADRPHCLDVDIALASISDRVAYYAVPSMQRPGFVEEGNFSSIRYANNAKSLSAGTQQTEGAVHVPPPPPVPAQPTESEIDSPVAAIPAIPISHQHAAEHRPSEAAAAAGASSVTYPAAAAVGCAADGCDDAAPDAPTKISTKSVEMLCEEADQECEESLHYALSQGIFEHPNWYEGLDQNSQRGDFLELLVRTHRGGCDKLCVDGRPPAAVTLKMSCEEADRECDESLRFATKQGIFEHADWYEGLDENSPRSDFLKLLVRTRRGGCDKLCTNGEAPTTLSPKSTAEIQCEEADQECEESLHYAMQQGIFEHPDWYEGLDQNSQKGAFLELLARTHRGSCDRLCVDGQPPPPPSKTRLRCEEAEQECEQALQYATQQGIFEHPDWYGGLAGDSTRKEFLEMLARTHRGGCDRLCLDGGAAHLPAHPALQGQSIQSPPPWEVAAQSLHNALDAARSKIQSVLPGHAPQPFVHPVQMQAGTMAYGGAQFPQ